MDLSCIHTGANAPYGTARCRACALSCVVLRCAESVVNVALQLAAILYTERIRRRNANNKAPPVHYTGGVSF